jgi:hypothetical protein
MEINKLKKLLAEGNPDKQLDNIIESLSDRHDLRSKIKDKKAMETKAKIAQTMAQVGTKNIKDINAMNPAVGAEIMKNNYEAEATEDQAALYQNLASEARKKERKENKDPLSGVSEGVDNMELKNIKFGNKVETTPKSNKEVKEKTDAKEENLMKKEQKAIFEQSMADIFKILKEEDDEMTEEELMVGKVPAVEAPEVELPVEEEVVEVEPGQEVIQAEEPVLEPELQANDADVAIAEPEMVEEIAVQAAPEAMEEVPAEEVVEVESPIVDVPTDVQPEVLLTDNSIRIEIPIVSGENVVDEFSSEEADALQEAFRTVYRILGTGVLTENEESVEVPMDAQADLKIEGDKLVVEIPLENPVEEITQDAADALQEAISVISFLLKEEASESEEQQYKVEEEIAPVDAPEAVVKTEIKSGEIVIQPHDHADAEGEKVRDAVIQEELSPEEENGVRQLLQAKEEEYGVDFNGNGVVEPSENPKVEDEHLELIGSMVSEPHEIVQVPTDVPADVTVHADSIRVELPLVGELVDSLEGEEAIQEAFKFIYSVFKSQNLNEAESVEVPESAEAEITVEDGKLVIEIPVENPKEEVSPEEAAALQEAFDYISFVLNEKETDSKVAKAIKKVAPVAATGATGVGIAKGGEAIIRSQWQAAADAIRASLPSGRAVPQGALDLMFQKRLADAGLAASADAAVAAGGIGGAISAVGNTVGGALSSAGSALASGVGAVGGALLANPVALGIALGVPAFMAASYIAKGGIPRFLHKKLGLGKTGKVYKELDNKNKEVIDKNIASEYSAKINARKDFLNKQAAEDIKVKQAGRGLTFGSRALSSIPLINKLGNFKIFQNQDIQDKMTTDRKNLLNKYTNDKAAKKELKDNFLTFDPNTGKVDYSDWSKMSDAEKQQAATKKLEIEKNFSKTGDYRSAVDSIKTAEKDAKNQREINIASARAAEKAAQDAADLNIEKNRLLAKDKNLNDLLYQQAKATSKINEGFEFNVDSAYSLLEETPFSEDEKLDIIAEAYNDLYFVSLRENLENSGYSVSQKGLSLFLESKGAELSMEEKDGIMKSLNSESVKKDFEEHYQSKRHLDIKSEEITNKDMETGMKSEDVKPVIVESEEVKEPHTEELNHGGSDTIDADGQLAKDEEASEKKEELVVKAEPEDVVSEAVQYKSIKEAFLLESNYFETDSTSVVSANAKKDKLVNQIGLLVARDVQDPLYEELIRTTAVSKKLQEELQAKYKAVALKKAGELLEAKSKKSDNSQASSLEFITALYEETLQEGFGEWAKGKILMMVIGLLPESKLDEIIMKAKVRALQIGKSQEEKMEIGRLFKQATGSKAEKIKFIKKLVKEAPESQQANADEKLSKLVMSLKNKTEKQQTEGKSLQESLEIAINEGFWTEVGQAILASSPLSMVVGVLGGLAVAGIIALVTKLVKKLTKDQYELDY